MKAVFMLAAVLPALTLGADHYVSPAGSPTGSGSISSPWDIATAFAHPDAVEPGDTIWVMPGTYGNPTRFEVALVGTEEEPIIVRNYQNGRAIINGGLLVGCCDRDPRPELGAYVWFWGLEIANTDTQRYADSNGDIALEEAVSSRAPGARFINLIIHDTSQGIGLWTENIDGEAYGNVIFNNGYQGQDRAHGHGMYTQNDEGMKVIADNLIFNQFGLGIQVYGSESAFLRHYQIEGNIIFNNGAPSLARASDNFLVGGGQGAVDITLRDNHFYFTPANRRGSNSLGVFSAGTNRGLVAERNFFIGGGSAVDIERWEDLQFTGNTIYSEDRAMGLFLENTTPDRQSRRRLGQLRESFIWDNNRYFGSSRMQLTDRVVFGDTWPDVAGYDTHSIFLDTPPAGVWKVVRPNKYEPGRGHVIIYNWSGDASVMVDLSSILAMGANYEIRDAQNYFGSPVVSGQYTGGMVGIPMTGLQVAQPNGDVPNKLVHTAPGFGVFVVLPR